VVELVAQDQAVLADEAADVHGVGGEAHREAHDRLHAQVLGHVLFQLLVHFQRAQFVSKLAHNV